MYVLSTGQLTSKGLFFSILPKDVRKISATVKIKLKFTSSVSEELTTPKFPFEIN